MPHLLVVCHHTTPTRIDDVCPTHGRIKDALVAVANEVIATSAPRVDVHNLCIPGCPGHPHIVVGHRASRSRNSRAVKSTTGRLRQPRRIVVRVVAVGKVYAVHIINESIVVVINPVGWNFILIRPYIRQKVLVAPFTATVHHSNDDPRRSILTLDYIPRLWQPH